MGRRADRKRETRRGVGIHAYVGLNGAGKTLAMIYDTLPTLAGIEWNCEIPDHLHSQDDYVNPLTGEVGAVTSGLRRVLSTVEILDHETGLPHPLYDPLGARFGGWLQVLQAEHSDILFDEITGIAGSRESMAMPVMVQNRLQQLRKTDLKVRWTAPKFERADSILRGITAQVTLCRGYLPKRPKGDEVSRAWKSNRLFKLRTFDAIDFDDLTASKLSGDRANGKTGYALRPRQVQWWYAVNSAARDSYNTLESVQVMTHYGEDGFCLLHMQPRRKKYCDHD